MKSHKISDESIMKLKQYRKILWLFMIRSVVHKQKM